MNAIQTVMSIQTTASGIQLFAIPLLPNTTYGTFSHSSEHLFMQIADVIANGGYKDAGWEFVVMGDCWLAKSRDEDGKLQPDPKRYPRGIKFLVDYVRKSSLLVTEV